MKRRWVIVTAILFILGLFGAPMLFKLPALWPIFDYSKSNDLATAISGLTTPVISLVSIILIYLAFNKQAEANKILKEQNDSLKEQKDVEFIFSLFDQLDKELKKICFWEGSKTEKSKSAGYEAIEKLTNNFTWAYEEGVFVFSTDTNGRKIISISNAFQNILDSIEKCSVSSHYKTILENKAEFYYYSWLSWPFEKIVNELIRTYLEPPQEMLNLINLVKKYDNKSIPPNELGQLYKHHNIEKQPRDMDNILKFLLKQQNPLSKEVLTLNLFAQAERDIRYCSVLLDKLSNHTPALVDKIKISGHRAGYMINTEGRMFFFEGGFLKDPNYKFEFL